ncbi:hypothetical protein AG1IA_08591 [Rhizoctonia solani AG-1 IA]|uniref:Uncharacterized protein n=1 Tax=Thanatephorus cucumeris (strain AG1-IA) TaxID=983506 RepID=L8WGS5_THACA|nr:hypothetical protein AG1IA_08591 [Rhizoctonia solani AG-1 IA]
MHARLSTATPISSQPYRAPRTHLVPITHTHTIHTSPSLHLTPFPSFLSPINSPFLAVTFRVRKRAVPNKGARAVYHPPTWFRILCPLPVF